MLILIADNNAPFLLKICKVLFLKKLLGDMGVMERYIEQECQGEGSINYTVVKPPMLGKNNVTSEYAYSVSRIFTK